MKRTPVFLPSYLQDLEAEADYYARRLSELGNDFVRHADNAVDFILEWPEAATVVRDGIRRKWLKRFPLGVVYTIDDDKIIFIGIMHGTQNLGPWLDDTWNHSGIRWTANEFPTVLSIRTHTYPALL